MIVAKSCAAFVYFGKLQKLDVAENDLEYKAVLQYGTACHISSNCKIWNARAKYHNGPSKMRG